MKTLIALITFMVGSSVFAGSGSPFKSSVRGLSIPNSHVVTSTNDAMVLRGMAPTAKQIEQLKNLGVQEILIFKNETKNEVQEEIADLQAAGFDKSAITNIAFPWKDIYNFKQACQMTVQALRTIENASRAGRSIYFHCTVGEDRTGYLAGLWTLWSGKYKSIKQSFQEEMCARGYEAGDPTKPYKGVVMKIRETLTPTYLKMLAVLSDAKNRNLDLNESLCDQEPAMPFQVSDFTCAPAM